VRRIFMLILTAQLNPPHLKKRQKCKVLHSSVKLTWAFLGVTFSLLIVWSKLGAVFSKVLRRRVSAGASPNLLSPSAGFCAVRPVCKWRVITINYKEA